VVRHRLGMAFLRDKADGIIPELSVRENLTLAALPALTQWGIVSRKRQGELVDRFMQRLGIKATSAEQKIHELSGGNQQKVLLARWLCKNTKLLLLDRLAVSTLVQEIHGSSLNWRSGLGVLMISSEMEELVEGHSVSSSCVTGGQSRNSVASRRTRKFCTPWRKRRS